VATTGAIALISEGSLTIPATRTVNRGPAGAGGRPEAPDMLHACTCFCVYPYRVSLLPTPRCNCSPAISLTATSNGRPGSGSCPATTSGRSIAWNPAVSANAVTLRLTRPGPERAAVRKT
jgi:hypothetical protein